jgi:hypothetical protein
MNTNTQKQNWTAKHNNNALDISLSSDSKVWKTLGAKNESDRELLKSHGFQVVRVS